MGGPYDKVIVMLGLPGCRQRDPVRTARERTGHPAHRHGDLMRDAIRRGGTHGSLLGDHVAAGEFVPDELTVDVLRARLLEADTDRGFVLDGFPRTATQAVALAREFGRHGPVATMAVYLEVSEWMLRGRLAARRVCTRSGHPHHVTDHPPRRPDRCDVDGSSLERRADDEPEVFARRLRSQRERLGEVAGLYDRAGLLRIVDGGTPPLSVASAILDAIGVWTTRYASTQPDRSAQLAQPPAEWVVNTPQESIHA